MTVVHVLPVNDLIDHEDVGDECVCGPDVEFVSSGSVVTHHSLDGREKHESDGCRTCHRPWTECIC